VTSRHAVRFGLGVLLAGLCGAAPTAGDIGGCGQEAARLDEEKFFDEKARVDCARCDTCGLVGATCKAACDGTSSESFPDGCEPLVHDGEVCLRALSDADCDAYASYVADQGATTPTECAFCPLDPQGAAR